MEDFKERFEIVYKKFYDWGVENGFKPSKLAFSRFANVSQATMQRWEKGQIPNGKDLKTIHDKLGFAYDWLISGEGEMLDTTAQQLEARDKEIARLQTMIMVDGVGDKDARTNTGKAGEK